jgi:hypothetical protein
VQSTITCPECGFAAEESVPADACQFFYECRNCRVVLRPKPGDCCVFCSYGTEKCATARADGAAAEPKGNAGATPA